MEIETEMDRDEEDDHRILVPQNNTQRIRNLRNRISGLGFNKRYLFAILLLPLLILIIYFATDLKILFHSSVSGIKFHSSINRMRESQLRALYLLRQQQLGLFKLTSLNISNSANSTSNDTNSVPGDHLFEYLKSSVLNEISLNKQIQQVLLSSYQAPDFNSNISDSSLSGYADVTRCGKVDQMLSNRRTIQWKPEANKYLFAICVSGQMSNHLICLEKHMFFAALLNRVLVIPSPKVDFEFNRVLDIVHINKCLGREVVVTFEEYAVKKKNHLHIDKVICYFSLPHPCYMDNDHVKKLKSLGVSMSRPDTAWTEDVKKPNIRRADDVLRKFSCDDGVIAVGDLYFADVEKEWVMQAGGPIAHNCKTLVEPSRLIMLTAQRFIQTFLGDNFIALHFRRHGFLKFCNAKRRSCFFPIPQAADCINGVIEKASSGIIYLSTDAAESETSLLESLLVLNGKSVPLVKRPSRNSAEKWDALLYRHGLEQDPQVEAMLDKTICGLSKVFIGSSGSTFTEDILRLRKDWGSASLCDEYLCQGQVPNFIAGGEED